MSKSKKNGTAKFQPMKVRKYKQLIELLIQQTLVRYSVMYPIDKKGV